MFPIKGLIPQIGNDMVSELIRNKVDNPYLKALLAPLASLFTGGILNGLMPQNIAGTMAEKVQPGNFDTQGNANSNASPAALKLRDEFTPVVEKLILDMNETPPTTTTVGQAEQSEIAAREGKV